MSRRAHLYVYAFGAALVAGAGALGWYITQRASQNRALVASTIGDVTLAYAPAYARFGGGQSGGRFETLELATTFPDFRPAGASATPLAEADGSGRNALVFFTFGRADRKMDPADMVGMLYARFLEPGVEETEEGLIKRVFQDGSPYQGEDLYFAPPEGRAFAARCARPTVPSDGLPETCLSVFREGGLDIAIRFGRPLLARWERLAPGARALVQTMLAR
ncbi:MAG: hypothetical protein KDJ25_17095 [Rhodoblastus sp.]|nr:hypothetical protein [Rhodoblastus sp.]